jgi:hypothetical protein
LRWYYGFNLEASVRCHRIAAALDPRCAMAHFPAPASLHHATSITA